MTQKTIPELQAALRHRAEALRKRPARYSILRDRVIASELDAAAEALGRFETACRAVRDYPGSRDYLGAQIHDALCAALNGDSYA